MTASSKASEIAHGTTGCQPASGTSGTLAVVAIQRGDRQEPGEFTEDIMGTWQIQCEHDFEALVLEFSRDTGDRVQRHDEHTRVSNSGCIECRLKSRAFGDSDLANKKAASNQNADDDGGEQEKTRAQRFQNRVAGYRGNPVLHEACCVF